MRSSLGAPHSTERCKITKIPQSRQIFPAFSVYPGLFLFCLPHFGLGVSVLIAQSDKFHSLHHIYNV